MKNVLPVSKAVLMLLIFFSCFFGANAQPVIGYQQVATGLNNPVDVVSAPGDTRLFIAQQNGLIRIWNGTSLIDFINLSSVITPLAGGEQGLLSVAFHPSYNVNRYFFVWYTNSTGAVTLARYQRNASNPDLADLASGQVLLSIAKPGSPYFTNHNGGKLNFGPDGMLYIGTGDGGSGGDPFNLAQNGNSLLGKMLRINVNSFATSAPFYDIPADNPYVGASDGILDEVYALGLRNPWRWSFDRATGDMWIGDVGQNVWEEVNWLPAGSTSGVNYGWKCYEGNHLYGSGCSPAVTDTITPVFEYPHNSTTGGFSITGGYVYRGPDPANAALLGYYITTDYVTSNLWLIRPNGAGGFTSTQQSGVFSNISSFGEGADGTLYAIRRSTGILYKVIVTSVVPVTISRFTAAGFDGYNLLNWQSETESNIAAYYIEYSSNGRDFTRAGRVTAAGNASARNYTFRHDIQLSGNVYYRLAIEEINGQLRYSDIVRLLADDGYGVKIFPTVISNATLNLVLLKPAKNIQLMNSNGAMVYQKNTQGLQGNVQIMLPYLSKGVYMLRVNGNNFVTNKKIIVQ